MSPLQISPVTRPPPLTLSLALTPYTTLFCCTRSHPLAKQPALRNARCVTLLTCIFPPPVPFREEILLFFLMPIPPRVFRPGSTMRIDFTEPVALAQSEIPNTRPDPARNFFFERPGLILLTPSILCRKTFVLMLVGLAGLSVAAIFLSTPMVFPFSPLYIRLYRLSLAHIKIGPI